MKKLFTLIELLVVIFVLSLTILSIVVFATRWITFSERTKKIAITTNIAREWIEAVFNIRNTNWLKYSGKATQCWLKENPIEEDNDWDCSNDLWIKWGYYVLLSDITWYNKYWYLSWVSFWLDIYDSNFQDNKVYQLCNNSWYWDACPNATLTKKDISQWRFYRQIRVIWLKDKQNNNNITCNDWSTCGSYQALELQFCSKWAFVADINWEIELCSVITNFKY